MQASYRRSLCFRAPTSLACAPDASLSSDAFDATEYTAGVARLSRPLLLLINMAVGQAARIIPTKNSPLVCGEEV